MAKSDSGKAAVNSACNYPEAWHGCYAGAWNIWQLKETFNRLSLMAREFVSLDVSLCPIQILGGPNEFRGSSVYPAWAVFPIGVRPLEKLMAQLIQFETSFGYGAFDSEIRHYLFQKRQGLPLNYAKAEHGQTPIFCRGQGSNDFGLRQKAINKLDCFGISHSNFHSDFIGWGFPSISRSRQLTLNSDMGFAIEQASDISCLLRCQGEIGGLKPTPTTETCFAALINRLSTFRANGLLALHIHDLIIANPNPVCQEWQKGVSELAQWEWVIARPRQAEGEAGVARR